jgi:hypothetical protein
MPSRKKIDREKVLASVNVTCPNCGRIIGPQDIRRVSWEEILCPDCENRFDAKKARAAAVKRLMLELAKARGMRGICESATLKWRLHFARRGRSTIQRRASDSITSDAFSVSARMVRGQSSEETKGANHHATADGALYTCRGNYSPWVADRQRQLEQDVRRAWNFPEPGTKGTRKELAR